MESFRITGRLQEKRTAQAVTTNRQSIGSDGYDTDQYVQGVEENYASDSSEDSSFGII